jgi:aryl-alcohol dehydrogenase-like predicted oxidoreductase
VEYKTLGNTGLLVSKLCLGTMTFGPGQGDYKLIGNLDQKGADELVKGALDAGVNFFDTADIYSDGESEKILGQSFKNLGVERKDVVIATKVYGRMGPGRNDVGASRGHIMDGVEAALKGFRLITSTSFKFTEMIQSHLSKKSLTVGCNREGIVFST